MYTIIDKDATNLNLSSLFALYLSLHDTAHARPVNMVHVHEHKLNNREHECKIWLPMLTGREQRS